MSDKIGEVVLKNVRLSFFNGFKPDKYDKYSSSFLIDPSTPDGAKNDAIVKAAILAVRVAKWGQQFPKLKPEKLAYRNGDDEAWDGYAGCWYVSASNPSPPIIVDRDPKKRLDERSGRPYSGCVVNAVVRFWAQDSTEWGQRINASLETIQFVSDGESFGKAPIKPEDYFGELVDSEPVKAAGGKGLDSDDYV